MKILGLGARRASSLPSDIKSLTVDQLAERLEQWREEAGVVVVTPETALHAPSVAAIVRAFVSAMISLPFSVYQKEDRSRVPVSGHPLNYLLNIRPNMDQTAEEFWTQAAKQIPLHGFFLAEKMRGSSGQITELIPIPPRAVTFEMDGLNRRRYRVTMTTGEKVLTGEDVFFISDMLSDDGVTPISPVHQVPEAIGLELAAQKFGSQLFNGSAIPNVVIERPGTFRTRQDQEDFANMWGRMFRRKRGTAVMEQGWTIKPLQLSNEESQFLETRKLQRSIIAGAWGVPPHKVGDMEKATYRNLEEASISWVRDSVTPFVQRIEGAITRDLMTEREIMAGLYPRFNVDGLMRGDIKSRSEALSIQLQSGVISPNEWRALEERNPREDEDGDAYLTPLNMRQSTDEDEDGESEERAAPDPVRKLRPVEGKISKP